MTTGEMVSIVWDVIDANVEYAPDDLPESEIGEWVEREGWPIRHVHDGRWVNVYAGATWLFRCTPAQYQKVMDQLAEESSS